VRFVSFTTNQTNNFVVLNWKTENEIEIKEYEIFYSADGLRYNSIGTKEAIGGAQNNYQFTSTQTQGYFKIEMKGKDGSAAFSNIVKSFARSNSQTQILPNPVYDNAIISIRENSLSGSRAVLLNTQGQALENILLQTDRTNISLKKYAAGIYWLKLADGEVLKIVKK